MPCRKFIVRGRVQGVLFRASTRSEALQLGLTGVACNCEDGSVEVIACGEPDALAQLENWLQRGPPAARVESVVRQDHAEQEFVGFETA
ncbi:MAG: acylphosphatase [Dokdonella sp.]